MAAENENKPLTMSDEQILGQICSTHVSDDTEFEAGSLFTLVQNVLARSTHIVDNVVKGTQGNTERNEDLMFPANFSSPLCKLKQISSELSCKPPGEENAHKTTVAILNKLSTYSWHAKAVLTLAAFALEYGDFWLLSQQQPTDLLAKSLAIIKRVPTLTNPTALQKHHDAILEINNLIKATLQVIELIFELAVLASTHNTKDVPALVPALEQIPFDVYWAIISVAAIVTQIDSIINDKDTRQELVPFSLKINFILSKLRKQISSSNEEIKEAEYLNLVRKYFQTPTEVNVALKFLFFGNDTPEAPIYDGATKTQVSIDVLQKKSIFLFFSTLDITASDFDYLRPIYDKIKTKNQHKIVWVPIVEEWNDELQKQFDSLKSKMPWYVLKHFEPIRGIRFIKEEFQFTNKPTVVVLSPQTKILHHNAFYMIKVWGLSGFPFSKSKENSLTLESSWIQSLVIDIHPHIPQWFKEQKYIFFYGGKEEAWVEEFKKYATKLADDSTLKEAKISIELCCIESEPVNVSFWNGVENLFMSKVDNTTKSVTQEVQKLLSYKNERGWALLSHGSTVLLTGHGTIMSKTVSELDELKESTIKTGSFKISFKESYRKVVSSTPICSHLEIPKVNGKIPDTIECPECNRKMEVFVSYKCCHTEEKITASAKH